MAPSNPLTVHETEPTALDLEAAKKMDPIETLQLAFDAAELHLNVPRLLEPSDFVGSEPVDEKSVTLLVGMLSTATISPVSRTHMHFCPLH